MDVGLSRSVAQETPHNSSQLCWFRCSAEPWRTALQGGRDVLNGVVTSPQNDNQLKLTLSPCSAGRGALSAPTPVTGECRPRGHLGNNRHHSPTPILPSESAADERNNSPATTHPGLGLPPGDKEKHHSGPKQRRAASSWKEVVPVAAGAAFHGTLGWPLRFQPRPWKDTPWHGTQAWRPQQSRPVGKAEWPNALQGTSCHALMTRPHTPQPPRETGAHSHSAGEGVLAPHLCSECDLD